LALMIHPDRLRDLEIMGSDTLREYRDAMIAILAARNVPSDNVERNNVQIRLEHRAGRGEPATVAEFVLHPGQRDCFTGVMLNRETTRDHLWVEARWL
jgi:hypothetical protein